MSQSQTPPAGWYADPSGKHEKRYFDGSSGPSTCSSHGRQSVDPPGGPSHVPTVDPAAGEGATRRREGRRRRRAAPRRRRHALHRAGARGEPEGEAHRDQQRVRGLRPARHADRAGARGRAEQAKKAVRLLSLARPVPDPQAADRRHAGQRAARAHPAGEVRQVEDHRRGRAPAARSARSSSRTRSARSASGWSPAATPTARSTPRTGGPGTSTSRTTPAPRSPGSPRRGRAWPRRCSRRPTTTSCRSTGRSRSRCAASSSRPALSVDTALKQDSRGFG